METESENSALVYKAWLETRWRFFAGLILLDAVSICAVAHSAEAVILTIVPLFLIWTFSQFASYRLPLAETALHAVLIIGGGLVFYAFGVLASHQVRNEFSAIALALILCLVSYIAFNVLRVESFNPFDLMRGKHYLDPETFLLRGDLPWLSLGVHLAITATMIVLDAEIAERRDF